VRHLLTLQLRRDRVILTIWILGIAVLVAGSASAVSTEFESPGARAAVLRLGLATPSLLALRGIPNGDSAGSLLWFQVFTFLAVTVGLMNTFFATRHGRADEEHGRRELVAAGAVGRSAPLVATAVFGVAANVVLGLLDSLGFLAVGYEPEGSFLAGLALTTVGVSFLGIGMLAGELAPTSRSANSIGVVAVLLAYALRGAGDALGTPDLRGITLAPAWPSWLSPIGWAQKSLAFTSDRVGFAVLPVLLALAAGALAFVVHARRDLGAGLMPERDGRASAGRGLRSLFALDGRLQRGAIIGWSVGGALLGAITGALARAAQSVVSDNAQATKVLKLLAPSGQDTVGLLIGTIMILIGMLAAAAGIQGVLRVRAEEADGRAELVLASPVSRSRWLADGLLVGGTATASVMVLAGLAAAAGFAASGSSAEGWRALGQALAELPAALAAVALAAVLIAVLPRMSVLLAWLLFAAAIVIGLFGPLLKLPKDLQEASPFSHVPAVPFTDWTSTVVLLLVDVALAAVAIALVRRRDLTS
jgi:ABC-2 type transport system permease protein